MTRMRKLQQNPEQALRRWNKGKAPIEEEKKSEDEASSTKSTEQALPRLNKRKVPVKKKSSAVESDCFCKVCAEVFINIEDDKMLCDSCKASVSCKVRGAQGIPSKDQKKIICV